MNKNIYKIISLIFLLVVVFSATSQVVERFPKPDYVLATHTSGWDSAGDITYTPGYALANVDSVDIIIKGIGPHGSAPQMGKDPVVIGAQIVNALQTIVSRQIDVSQVPAVVSVGTFHAGVRNNIIPDTAELIGTIRSFDPQATKAIHDKLRRIVSSVAQSMGD